MSLLTKVKQALSDIFRLDSKDASSSVEAQDGGIVEIVAPNGVNIDGPITSGTSPVVTEATGDLRYLNESNNLSDLDDAGQARTNLGLGNAATATVQSSVTDATANRLLLVGAFGLGNDQLPLLSDTNSTTIRSGLYRVTAGGTVGLPTVGIDADCITNNGGFGSVIHLARAASNDAFEQMYFDATYDRIFWRKKLTGSPVGQWKAVYPQNATTLDGIDSTGFYQVANDFSEAQTRSNSQRATARDNLLSTSGLGTKVKYLSTVAELNTMSETGFAWVSVAGGDYPSQAITTGTYFVIHTEKPTSGGAGSSIIKQQLAFKSDGSAIYARNQNSGVWSDFTTVGFGVSDVLLKSNYFSEFITVGATQRTTARDNLFFDNGLATTGTTLLSGQPNAAILSNGWYQYSSAVSDPTGLPAGTWYIMHEQGTGVGNASQLAINTTNQVWTRTINGGTPTTWKRLLTVDDIGPTLSTQVIPNILFPAWDTINTNGFYSIETTLGAYNGRWLIQHIEYDANTAVQIATLASGIRPVMYIRRRSINILSMIGWTEWFCVTPEYSTVIEKTLASDSNTVPINLAWADSNQILFNGGPRKEIFINQISGNPSVTYNLQYTLDGSTWFGVFGSNLSQSGLGCQIMEIDVLPMYTNTIFGTRNVAALIRARHTNSAGVETVARVVTGGYGSTFGLRLRAATGQFASGANGVKVTVKNIDA